ncbi:hypothetical protein FRB96_003365 [Tulasnella sp. 330]|nr:hypothetical protein FRB96_003365 [Tulasnella sp. 330]KAG8876247.1 hypothetical protein FRB97_004321 [Tulasnella sp. 331]KAG8887441.1 hypothetical protein FRB98_009585 [Tulasnella sp. 332]
MPPSQTLPLAYIRVVEFAGLAPGPFAGLILADWGASVVRIDKVSERTAQQNLDVLSRGKRSIAINPKVPSGLKVLKKLVGRADVVIDPYRPGVLERLGLGPDVFLGSKGTNPRLVYARVLGFPPSGSQRDMAGHDLNYLAQSGVLSMMAPSTPSGKPSFPLNLLADFAGGGMSCAMGILLALFERERSGLGQVVENNMVDGTRYLSSFPLIHSANPTSSFGRKAGLNLLDGGAPFYDIYQCKDGGWMTVACLEPQFFMSFVKFLRANLPEGWTSPRVPNFDLTPASQIQMQRWPEMRKYFEDAFRTRSRDDWAAIFHGTDSCATPVMSVIEAAETNVPAPHPHLHRTPAKSGTTPDPDIGEHTQGILAELGITQDELKVMISECAVQIRSTRHSKL